ncbi:hypothetical protein Salat_2743300 [Sesamum alatum]|uniref:Uncharacterized protein n=1 Tax=Sesamum alatum TaxID=300844 RepID=A0AAE1XKX0_9LAMI|nr:hypothetical protein Salat_2743300 [Sesamum alatum]
MASTNAQNLPSEEETPHSTPIFRPSSARRTPSFSSSADSCGSSSFRSLAFSLAEEFPPFSPISTPLKFKGIPFSWEKLPGIPKNQGPKKKAYNSEHLLPLPPAGTTNAAAKKLQLHQELEISPKKSNRFLQRDPFFAALVECSKDDHDHHDDEHDHHHHHQTSNYGNNIWKGSSKITRTLSDRFGFISMYGSCKRTCAVSESLVYLPRPSPHYLLNRRSS